MNEIKNYRAGDSIIREGEVSKGFFILRSGMVEVLKGGVHIAEFSTRGTVFGEMSDILGKPRSCSIVAKTDCEIIYLIQDIDTIVHTKPTFARNLMRTLAERLKQTTEKYAATDTNLLYHFQEPEEEDEPS